MSVFLGTHENRFDAKGRVSIPAGFRTVLKAQHTEGDSLVILRPSHTMPCIEAWPAGAFSRLTQPLDRLDMFSDEHDDLAAACMPMRTRLIRTVKAASSSRFLREHAGITESAVVAFMGVGRTFQIWEPEAARQRREDARQRSRRISIPAARDGQDGGAA